MLLGSDNNPSPSPPTPQMLAPPSQKTWFCPPFPSVWMVQHSVNVNRKLNQEAVNTGLTTLFPGHLKSPGREQTECETFKTKTRSVSRAPINQALSDYSDPSHLAPSTNERLASPAPAPAHLIVSRKISLWFCTDASVVHSQVSLCPTPCPSCCLHLLLRPCHMTVT